jgi:hypothetical protein
MVKPRPVDALSGRPPRGPVQPLDSPDNRPCDGRRCTQDFRFPDANDGPAECHKVQRLAAIAADVSPDFGDPEVSIASAK